MAKNWIYQQDNASIHRAHETRTWFKDHGVDDLDWPARPSDLNPIENLWAILERTVYPSARQFLSTKDLTSCIMECWEKIEDEVLHNLVASMPRRCAAVMVKQGSKTKY
ncbi:unnamed protein product [Chondrus crispus]|uniref:Tc1-like transposase DDE domain-containing protein n=1 Tax=Chondrus crispus TaxID=2769 RepID=R7QEZ1_CHOCR|nr:unnamed protein product [Chondrus crispus]CDF36001.1 unnamed protein product [Chondrus crispus]|eukprot:XP_005715820.1 unnamed protein product [Chondrus crispus]